jgi:hypothetical protein
MFNFVLGFLVGVATGTAGLVCFALARNGTTRCGCSDCGRMNKCG